jgi:putative ABC transport system permease protein
MHGFATPLPDAGIVLGATARAALDAAVGDRVVVTVPTRDASVEVAVAGFVDEPVPSVSYVSIDQWSAGGTVVDTAVLGLVDRDAHDAVRAAVQLEPGVTAVVDQQASRQAIEQLLGLTFLFVGLMVAFALVMAVALVYNMVSVSLAERTGEVATLQANGVGRSFIRRTVTFENLLTVLAGVVPGAVLGWLVAVQFVGQFDTESLAFELVLRNRSIAVAVVLVLASAMLAQWPGLRALARLDLATVMRERSE